MLNTSFRIIYTIFRFSRQNMKFSNFHSLHTQDFKNLLFSTFRYTNSLTNVSKINNDNPNIDLAHFVAPNAVSEQSPAVIGLQIEFACRVGRSDLESSTRRIPRLSQRRLPVFPRRGRLFNSIDLISQIIGPSRSEIDTGPGSCFGNALVCVRFVYFDFFLLVS